MRKYQIKYRNLKKHKLYDHVQKPTKVYVWAPLWAAE